MEGGINAWNGLVASGAPDAGMAFFSDADDPKEVIALAWMLEEGARRYYNGVVELLDDNDSRKLFGELSSAEVKHMALLNRLYRDITGDPSAPDLPGAYAKEELKGIMEGGMKIDEALAWAKKRERIDILEFSIAMETNSYDLYLKMERTIGNEDSQNVFRTLAEEEKEHLERIASLIGK